MSDFYLDPVSGDLVVTDDVRFTSGIETVAQAIELRMSAVKGEWFADFDNGIPLFEEVLGQKLDKARISAIYRKVLIETPGVDSITKFKVAYIGTNRNFTIDWEVRVGSAVLNGSLDT